jgi:D-sedoheptulose 7-phosphate isomerase
VAELPADRIGGIVDRLIRAYDNGNQLLLMGNGGSSSTASHLMNDFQKCIYLTGGKPFRALALTDSVSLLTAWANDTSYENVFAEQVRTWARPGDLVLAISGSGNSPNVLRAVTVARECGAYTIGLAGYQGGKMAEVDTIDHLFVVPSVSVHRIQEAQTTVYHVLWRLVQDALGT